MNDSVETTVIGSYPTSQDSFDLMKAYYNGIIPSWQPYIHKAVSSIVSAGIDIISDGQTRDPFVHIFIRGLQGCRIRNRPEVIDQIDLRASITKKDIEYASALFPQQKILGLIIGPCTLSESVVDNFYNDKKELSFAFSYALKKEIKWIEPIVDIISIDEPFFANHLPDYGKEIFHQLTKGVQCPTRLHVCGDVSDIVHHLVDFPVDILSHEFKATPKLFQVFTEHPSDKEICLGSVRSDKKEVEPVNDIITHINKANKVFGSKIKQIAPDCGLRMLPEKIAYQKLKHLSLAKRAVYE